MRAFLLLLGLLFYCAAQAQTRFNLFEGIGKFQIGSALDTSDGVLCLTGKFADKGKREEYYSFKNFNNKVVVEGVTFYPFFQYVNGELQSVALYTVYTYEQSPKYKENAQQDFEKLKNYITEQLDKKGKKKTFLKYPTQLNAGYRWKQNGLALDLIHVSNPRDSRYYPSVQIELHVDN